MRMAAVAAATLLAAAAAACGGEGALPGEVTPNPQTAASQGTDHALGPPDAPVVIVEYADYQ